MDKIKTDSTGIILLAAGESSRLGEPKQLLQFKGETLLRRTAKIALGVSKAVVVALGANIEMMSGEIADLPVQIAENKDWKTGMSGSIKIGLEKLLAHKTRIKSVIVLVCDQPFVDEKLLREIIKKFKETDALIVACEYQNTLGVPALFSAKLFPEIFALDAQTGAKQLIKKYNAQTAIVPFPEGAFDIDTPTDYENLKRDFKR